MAIYTDIGWADSTSNGQIGCNGCELYVPSGDPDKWTCYAKNWVDRFAGHSAGYPSAFDKPQIFDGRFQRACKWPDLTGHKREEKRGMVKGVGRVIEQAKPWLDGLPRHIFPNDLGDTWTESLPIDWLLPYVDAMEGSPHVWMWLTKRVDRAHKFFADSLGYVPTNFYLGTSVTSFAQVSRIFQLLKFKQKFPDTLIFLSLEPLLSNIRLSHLPSGVDALAEGVGWAITGGESGALARAGEVQWLRDVANDCTGAKVPCFIKQLGAITDYRVPGMLHAMHGAAAIECEHGYDVCPKCDDRLDPLWDKKGGDWREWTNDLRVRQMPRTDFVLKKVGQQALAF